MGEKVNIEDEARRFAQNGFAESKSFMDAAVIWRDLNLDVINGYERLRIVLTALISATYGDAQMRGIDNLSILVFPDEDEIHIGIKDDPVRSYAFGLKPSHYDCGEGWRA